MKKKTNTKSIWITVIFLLLLIHLFRLADRNDWLKSKEKDSSNEIMREDTLKIIKEIEKMKKQNELMNKNNNN